jgi:hypothetical protein
MVTRREGDDTIPLAMHGQRCNGIRVLVQMRPKATTDLSQLSAIEHSDQAPLNAICRVAIGPYPPPGAVKVVRSAPA